MERNITKTQHRQKDAGTRNAILAHQVVTNCLNVGVADFCLCTGARNSAFIDCLDHLHGINTYYFYDERCAAFFALGRSRATQRPTAVITTSGTAVGELLPAVMEAYYSGVPLLVISADRPRCFRGTGAPQAAEQVGIFGIYTPFVRDIEFGENPSLDDWQLDLPGQLNVCLQEAYNHSFDSLPDFPPVQQVKLKTNPCHSYNHVQLEHFFQNSNHPIAIVSTLPQKDREAVISFLRASHIPVYCEGPSGIRESTALEKQRLTNIDGLWDRSIDCGYPVDGVLRIGGVPTTRIWRDLESKEGDVNVCSISHLPFSGLSWGDVVFTDLSKYFSGYQIEITSPMELLNADQKRHGRLNELLRAHQGSEPSIFRQLSQQIPQDSMLYLGNSLPIREWDLAATFEQKSIVVEASRGLNGIDGQLSTFLGLADLEKNNWAILGDLTTLYDLSAPWVISQIQAKKLQIVVINNGGGMIFSRLFSNEKLQNQHKYSMKAVADLWGLEYQCCKGEVAIESSSSPRLIECIPEPKATEEFWNEYRLLTRVSR